MKMNEQLRELTNPANTPKLVREALCAAQSALNEKARRGVDVVATPYHVRQIQALIDAIDVHRPLGPDGKHNDRHTQTCGCEDHRRAWSITLHP